MSAVRGCISNGRLQGGEQSPAELARLVGGRHVLMNSEQFAPTGNDTAVKHRCYKKVAKK
jgi:hypothetical protein